MIEVLLNGEKKSFDNVLSIKELLMKLGINPDTVVVEQNMRVLKKIEHEVSYIKNGDVIEVVHFVGGG